METKDVRCNNCLSEYYEHELKQLVDKFDNELVTGCPGCKTDAYLMEDYEHSKKLLSQ